MQKVVIYSMVILIHCLSVKGQVNFGSIKICHDANKALKQITVKEYVVDVQNGQLTAFHSLDGIVTYNKQDRKLALKDPENNKQDVDLQLTDNGEVIVTNQDKTITLKKLRSRGPDTAITIKLPAVTFSAVFVKGGLKRIWVNVSGKYVTLTMHDDSKGYNWDVLIGTESKQNALLLSQSGGRDFFLSLHDDSSKVGIRLWSDKQNGIFSRLEGLINTGEDVFSSAPAYMLLYSQKGILKKNKWKEPLICN